MGFHFSDTIEQKVLTNHINWSLNLLDAYITYICNCHIFICYNREYTVKFYFFNKYKIHSFIHLFDLL